MLAKGADVEGLASRLVKGKDKRGYIKDVSVKCRGCKLSSEDVKCTRQDKQGCWRWEWMSRGLPQGQYSRSDGRCISVSVYGDKVVRGRSCCLPAEALLTHSDV